ncbi:RidA family protein [Oceanobacillus bengalensis]|uniref:RidA family protein n=2 Tax=Oceanobacillus bengalensis TaxID=1435466 RepID=A0A494YXK1_9BACI|nr:RidA family protein [Oceanobacillus bengalensis]
MIKKMKIMSENAPQPTGPYSQGVKVGPFLFISGQDGVLPNGEIAGDSLAEQTKACLRNIESILHEAGATLENLVHMTCHLSILTEENVSAFNQAYSAYFKNIEIKPTRITVGSDLLDTDIEITAVAYINK